MAWRSTRRRWRTDHGTARDQHVGRPGECARYVEPARHAGALDVAACAPDRGCAGETCEQATPAGEASAFQHRDAHRQRTRCDVKRQERPKQGRGHALDESPEAVARAVEIAERRTRAADAAADMGDDSGGRLQYAPAQEPQAEAEVDVLEIAEIARIEAAGGFERFAPHQHGGGAGAEAF